MAPAQFSTVPLTIPQIHSIWTAALTLPPTPRLSALRRLLRIITSSSNNPNDTIPIFPPQSLAVLYLDLALSYAFLGEYYLASVSFHEAAKLLSLSQQQQQPSNNHHNDNRYQAFALFGLGLAKAELGKWKGAKREWSECLACFETSTSRCGSSAASSKFSYRLHQGDPQSTMLNGGLGREWILERERVEWNFGVALMQTGSRRLPVGIKLHGGTEEAQGEQHAVNGIPAGIRFGPDWQDGVLESTNPRHDRPIDLAEASGKEEGKRNAGFGMGLRGFGPLEDIGKASPPKYTRTWPQDENTLQTTIPEAPHAPFLAGAVSFSNNNSPTLGRHPFSHSQWQPNGESVPVKDPVDVQSPYNKSPLSYYFSPDCVGEGEGEGEGDVEGNEEDIMYDEDGEEKEAAELWEEEEYAHNLQLWEGQNDEGEQTLEGIVGGGGGGGGEEESLHRDNHSSRLFIPNIPSNLPSNHNPQNIAELDTLLPRAFEGFEPRK